MLQINKILTQELFEECQAALYSDADKIAWGVSRFGWESFFANAFMGAVFVKPVPDKLQERLKEHFSKIIDDIDQYDVNMVFQVWDRNSGIPFHDDHSHKKAITVYLNDEWSWEDGGLFIYDDGSESVKAIMPRKNRGMIIEGELHAVTAISPYARETRNCLQVWLD